MKLRPTTGKVLVKAFIPEDVSPGGILLPQDRAGDPKDDPRIGTVLAVGPPMVIDCGRVVPMPVKKGDKIIFTDFHTSPTGIENGLMVCQEDIAAIIED